MQNPNTDRYIAAGVAVVIVLGVWGFLALDGFNFLKEKSTSPSSPQVGQSTVPFANVRSDGSLPVNVWSNVIEVGGVNCSLTFDSGNGSVYRVQYRYYDKHWKDHTPNTFPSATEVRFMMLREGITKVPVLRKCPDNR